MVESRIKDRVGGLGLILFGLAGIAYRLMTDDPTNVYHLSLFFVTVLAGVASLLDSHGYARTIYLLAAGVSLVGAIGRASDHGITNPLAIVLGLLGIVFLWKSYRSNRPSTTGA